MKAYDSGMSWKFDASALYFPVCFTGSFQPGSKAFGFTPSIKQHEVFF